MNLYKKNLKKLTESEAYYPSLEHDACGVGLVASTEGKKSRKIVEFGIQALKAVWHRGAVDADGKTGDGAGIHIEIPTNYKISALAIGNFDGVHKGHQEVFKETRKFAKRKKIKFGVLTFTPLPIMFFYKNIKNFRLTSEDQKIKLFKKHQVDFIINIKFNKKQ